MGISVGIDLGTSNSVVALMGPDGPVVLTDGGNRALQPSVIALGHGGKPVVGHVARQQLTYAPETTVSSAKRLIGRRYHDEEIQRVRASVGWGVAEGEQGDARIRIKGKAYTVQEVSAHVLRHMVHIAEEATGETVDSVVITVPAYFNDQQRQATRDAAKIARLKCLRIINEPTAAAMAYGYDEQRNQRVVVYDLGGGTFDVSVLHIADDLIEVIATAGDTFLGGDDFDLAIATHLRKAHEGGGGAPIPNDHQSKMRLLAAAEQIKCELSESEQSTIRIPGLARRPDGRPEDVQVGLNRTLARTLCLPLIQRSFVVCDEVLANAGLSPAQIDAVVLVGGMTRFPIIKEAVTQYFSKEAVDTINPDEVVALGAAIQAANLTQVSEEPGQILLDVTPQTLGIRTVGGFLEPLIPRNTAIPTMSSQVFHTASDDQTEVRIRVYQGDQREARKNFLLGEFVLDGLPIGPRGTAKVRVTFAIDADGIVNITAEDVDGSNSRGIRVEASSSLSGAQVEELVFDDEPEHLLPGEDGSLIPALDNDDFALETEELEVDETEELEVDEDDDDLNLDEDENEHLG